MPGAAGSSALIRFNASAASAHRWSRRSCCAAWVCVFTASARAAAALPPAASGPARRRAPSDAGRRLERRDPPRADSRPRQGWRAGAVAGSRAEPPAGRCEGRQLRSARNRRRAALRLGGVSGRPGDDFPGNGGEPHVGRLLREARERLSQRLGEIAALTCTRRGALEICDRCRRCCRHLDGGLLVRRRGWADRGLHHGWRVRGWLRRGARRLLPSAQVLDHLADRGVFGPGLLERRDGRVLFAPLESTLRLPREGPRACVLVDARRQRAPREPGPEGNGEDRGYEDGHPGSRRPSGGARRRGGACGRGGGPGDELDRRRERGVD